MTKFTQYHDYEYPELGSTADWDDLLNTMFRAMDADIVVRVTQANLPGSSSDEGVWYLVTDTSPPELHYDDGSSIVTIWDGTATPDGHAASHKDGGSDELDAAELAAALGTTGELLQSDGAAASWVAQSSIDAGSLGGSSGTSGQFLQSDGSLASWVSVDAADLGGSSGSNGNVLTTDGSAAGWSTQDSLDAGSVDGYEGSDLAALAESEAVTAQWDFEAGLTVTASATSGGARIRETGDVFEITPLKANGSYDSDRRILYDPSVEEWDIEGVPRAGGDSAGNVKTNPNLHLPGTELEATGGNDTATQSVYVPAGDSFYLYGWGVIDETGSSPSGVDLYLKSGDLTGGPTTEHSDTTTTGWDAASAGSSLTSVSGGTSGLTVHVQMVNTASTAASNVSLRASYEVR